MALAREMGGVDQKAFRLTPKNEAFLVTEHRKFRDQAMALPMPDDMSHMLNVVKSDKQLAEKLLASNLFLDAAIEKYSIAVVFLAGMLEFYESLSLDNPLIEWEDEDESEIAELKKMSVLQPRAADYTFKKVFFEKLAEEKVFVFEPGKQSIKDFELAVKKSLLYPVIRIFLNEQKQFVEKVFSTVKKVSPAASQQPVLVLSTESLKLKGNDHAYTKRIEDELKREGKAFKCERVASTGLLHVTFEEATYVEKEKIGRGAFGDVYKVEYGYRKATEEARRKKFPSTLVVKTPRLDYTEPGGLTPKTLANTAYFSRKINGIGEFYLDKTDVKSSVPYALMTFLSGVKLASLIESLIESCNVSNIEKTSLIISKTIELFIKVIQEVMIQLHHHKIVHSDLHLENILIAFDEVEIKALQMPEAKNEKELLKNILANLDKVNFNKVKVKFTDFDFTRLEGELTANHLLQSSPDINSLLVPAEPALDVLVLGMGFELTMMKFAQQIVPAHIAQQKALNFMASEIKILMSQLEALHSFFASMAASDPKKRPTLTHVLTILEEYVNAPLHQKVEFLKKELAVIKGPVKLVVVPVKADIKVSIQRVTEQGLFGQIRKAKIPSVKAPQLPKVKLKHSHKFLRVKPFVIHQPQKLHSHRFLGRK